MVGALAALATAFVARAPALSSSLSSVFPLSDVTSVAYDTYTITSVSSSVPLSPSSPSPPPQVARVRSAMQMTKGAPGVCDSREYVDDRIDGPLINISTQVINVGSLNAAATPPMESYTQTMRVETTTSAGTSTHRCTTLSQASLPVPVPVPSPSRITPSYATCEIYPNTGLYHYQGTVSGAFMQSAWPAQVPSSLPRPPSGAGATFTKWGFDLAVDPAPASSGGNSSGGRVSGCSRQTLYLEGNRLWLSVNEYEVSDTERGGGGDGSVQTIASTTAYTSWQTNPALPPSTWEAPWGG